MPILTHLILTLFAINTLVIPSKSPKVDVSTEYIIMPLDCQNQKEIVQVLDIFQDKDVQEMTSRSACNIEQLIKNLNIPKTILVYKDTQSKTIQGVLIFRFDRNENDCDTYISTIATHKNFRRKKVASSLLQHAENIAQNNKSHTISLCVYANNYNALKCYLNHGFSVTADTSSYLTMSKELTSLTIKDTMIN